MAQEHLYLKRVKVTPFPSFSKQMYVLEIVQELHTALEHNLPDFTELCLNYFSYKESAAQRNLSLT